MLTAMFAGWLVLAAIAGCGAAWLWRGRMMGNRMAALQSESSAKQEQLKRDLDVRLSRLENDLLGAKELVRARDSTVAERDRLIRQQTELLAENSSRIASLTAESEERQEKLTQRDAAFAALELNYHAEHSLTAEQKKQLANHDARLAQLAPVPAKLAATEEELKQTWIRLASVQALVNTQDREISQLHKRTVELEPLTIQVKDRQARLVETEGQLAEAVRSRDSEIAQLKKRLAEFEPLPRRLNETEARRIRLADELEAMRRAKDEEIESLQVELKAVAELQQRLGERDGQMLASREQAIVATRNHDLDRAVLKTELARRARELDAKDTTIGRAYQQLAEFAPLPEALAKRSARALELARGIAQREQSLRLALGEAANLRASVLQWMRVGGALAARDAEIARLRLRLASI